MVINSLYIAPVAYEIARNTVAEFVCSQCYGHLVEHPIDTGVMVLCGTCGEDTKGYVRKQYVERRRQESQHERLEAKQVLKSVIKPAISGKTETQNLHELGF